MKYIDIQGNLNMIKTACNFMVDLMLSSFLYYCNESTYTESKTFLCTGV